MSETQSPAGAPLDGLTAFQRDLLAVLANGDDPMSGQDIKRRLEPLYESQINSGRLYPNLDGLVEDGLVSRGSFDRRTNAYGLTEAGERKLTSDHRWRVDDGE